MKGEEAGSGRAWGGNGAEQTKKRGSLLNVNVHEVKQSRMDEDSLSVGREEEANRQMTRCRRRQQDAAAAVPSSLLLPSAAPQLSHLSAISFRTFVFLDTSHY